MYTNQNGRKIEISCSNRYNTKNTIDLYGLHPGVKTFIVNKLTCPPARVEVLKTFDIKLNISNDFSTTETARESRLPSSSPGFAGTVAENKKFNIIKYLC